MAEYAAIPSCAKLQPQRSCYNFTHFLPKNPCLGIVPRRHLYRNSRIVYPSSLRDENVLSICGTSKRTLNGKDGLLKSCCLGTLISSEIATLSDGIVVVDQILLMASVFLAYMAGVVPSNKVYFNSRKNVAGPIIVPDSPIASGSSVKSNYQVPEFAWNEVKGKLIRALDVINCDGSLDSEAVERDKHSTKSPLSLYALAEAPRLRLLLITLERLEKEVDNISASCNVLERDDRLALMSKIIQKCGLLIFDTWLEQELSLENRKPDKENFLVLFKKIEGDETIFQNITRSGKEDLYSEFLYLLRFRSLSEASRYDMNLFTSHGVDILEDLVITLADGITSNYLELISVDSNMSNEMNRLGLIFCLMSTRELQRLRNEVALNKWLHQNMESVVSMYEDRFDLCTLSVQLLENPNKRETEKVYWWQKLRLKKPASTMSLQYIVISQLPMAVKRTAELRALTGWRYYFSLYLELSDIAMPMVKVIFAKVSSAISFFLVSLIGRSLGLIYTGIRQSLGWR